MKSTTDAVIKKLINIIYDKRLESNAVEAEVSKEGSPSDASILGITGSSSLPAKDTSTETSENPAILKCPYPGLENVVFIKGSGPHRLQYDIQSGEPIKEVIVSRKCAESVLRGAQVCM